MLWNGSKAEVFESSRGERQGDSISRYIFVICIEKLVSWFRRGWQLKSGNLFVSLWMDRLSLDFCRSFYSARWDDLWLFEEILNRQGWRWRWIKLNILFSSNINHKWCEEISSLLGYITIGNLGKYLGVNLNHKRVGR